MKRRYSESVSVLLVFSALLTLLFAAAPPAVRAGSDDSPEEAGRRLQKDGWVVDSLSLRGEKTPGVRHLEVTGRIAAPLEDVWTVISRVDEERRKWPGMKETVVEHANVDTLIARYTMSVPIYPDRHYRLLSIAEPDSFIYRFRMIPGYGNVKEIKGCWKVASLGDSLTRVEYVLDTDPGVSLVPGFIVNWATRKAVPRAYEFLAKLSRDHAQAAR